jgi:serine protease Do
VARGYIGVLVDNLSPEIALKMGLSKDLVGPVVTHVYPGEPADRAGVKPYDVMIQFNGAPVRTGADLISAVTGVAVGDKVPLRVSRNGKIVDLMIKVGQRPGPGGPQSEKKEETRKGKTKKRVPVETGMSLEDMTPEAARELGLPEKFKGVVVSSVGYGGPADKAGLVRGDVILEVDRVAVKSVDSFFSMVNHKKSYLLRVRRADAQGHESFAVIVLDLLDLKESGS